MRKLKQFVVFLCLFACLSAHAGQVTGLIQSAGGTPLSNASLTFTPTMFSIVAGSFVQTAASVPCYTDALGNVVGLPNPLVNATAAAANSGSLTAATTYYLQFTYWVGATETAPSPEFAFFLPGGQSSINITAPALQPTGATGYRVYASTTPGGEKLQQTVTGFGNTSITSLLSVTSVTSSNNTVCSFNFSDSLIPQARYVLAITDSSGSQVPGWPQTYYMQGSTFNLNTAFPTANTTAIFQNAIVSTPSGGVTQSIFGGLNLNGFGLTAGSVSASGLVSAYTSAGELIGKYSTISAAYAALPSGNGRIEPSCGIYNENLTLTTSVTISGVDKSCVHVRPATTANPTISINATSVSAIDGILIENLSMECQALPLSVACGDGIFITGSQTTNQVNDHITLRDMVIGNMYQLNTLGTFGFNNGIEITGRAIWTSIERVQQNNGRNIGLKIALTGGLVGPVNGLHVISSSFFGNFNAGISVDCNGSISSCVTNEFDLTEATANGQNTALTPCAGWIFNGVWDERLHNAYAEANCPGSGDANSAQIRITGTTPSPNQIDISTFTFSMTAGAAKWGIYNDASRSSGTYDGLRFIGPAPATGSVHFANTSPDSHTEIINATNLLKPDIIADAFGNTHVSIPAAGIWAKTVINNASCPLATNKFDLYTGCTGVEWSMNSIGVTGGPATINNFTSGLSNQILQVCSDSGVITLANAAGGAGQMNFAAAANKLLQTNECIQLRRLVASDAWQEMLATATPKVLAQPGTIASPPITWAANPGDGFQQQSGGAGTISMTLGGVHQILWGAALQRMRASHVVGWSSNTDPSAAQADTALCRAAANVLEVSTSESCNANGSIKPAAVVSGGAAATLTGTGACATFSTQTGGSMAGRATCTGTTGASTLTITPGTTAPTGWVCYVQDQTTRANLFQQTSNTTGGCTLTVTSVTQNDVFVFTAIAF